MAGYEMVTDDHGDVYAVPLDYDELCRCPVVCGCYGAGAGEDLDDEDDES
jgi:hypothetical protein